MMSYLQQALMSASLWCVLVIGAGLGCDRENTPEQAPDEKTYDGLIVAMGDSLTAGLGVAPAKSYPALLEGELHRRGLNYRVINSGISGETSSGARSRIEWVLKMKPDIVILETGANDGLRGIEPQLVRKNIEEIIKRFTANDVHVILAGMRMVTNMGPDYLGAFNQIYPELAAKYPVTFMPFFLEGVALQPHLNQNDSIHPNEQGYQEIVDNLLPYVQEAIELRRKRR